MDSTHTIRFSVTTEIRLDVPSIGVLLLNSGVHPEIDPAEMRLFGYREDVTWPDGSVAPGVLAPIHLWYIETPDLKIVVDTGCSKENVEHANRVFRSRQQGQVYESRPEHDIAAFLASVGTSPEEIDLVILSHLHLDHCCNVGAYENARYLVQRRELPWGMAPPRYAPFHWREFTPYLTAVADRIDTIDGDATICPGVEAWLVGGHTPGSMVVAVRTSVGLVVIASDFFYTYRNIEFSWPPGSFSNLEEWEQNCRMIQTRADLILPSHDYEIWERHPEGRVG